MNTPTLLIGLGGAGGKIVEKVANIVTAPQRGNISFVVLDTDINDLRRIRKRNPFVRTIQTSIRQTVGEYLARDTRARDTWFPVHKILNRKALVEGAGQVRSISRLAFETAIRAGKMGPLHQAIHSLYRVEENQSEQALRVVIVSSLAGGTGSGLILPLALYTQNYLKGHFRKSVNITRGFFILPEVFYEVIKGEGERNNLKANAYATLRELDAFLMKGDGTLKKLHKRYQDTVKIEFPSPVSAEYEEYNVSPYDFCFLFDAQNAEGSKLNSYEQYLDHAANCIYAQSIGPMNKRSSSSEDNTIRMLAKELGRNRYAGAGASMLIYPFEDIRKFIALKWAESCISKEWMLFDNLYKELRKENDLKREEGLVVIEQSLSSFYVHQIDSLAKHDHPFAKAIKKSTGIYKGVTKTEDKWEKYVEAVLGKTEKDVKDSTSELNTKYEDARDQIYHLGNDWDEFEPAFNAAKEYRLMTELYIEEVSPRIAYSMFKGSRTSKSDLGQDYKLETHLVGADNNYMHPNAIRYMLIKILEHFIKEREDINKKIDDSKGYFEDFDKNFDDPKTEDVVETVEDLSDRKVSPIRKWMNLSTPEQEEFKQKFRTYLEKIVAYQTQCAQSVVLSQGINYIDSLIRSFEGFYNSLEQKIETLDNEIEDIYKKFSVSKGTTVRFVCSSKECLDKIYDNKPYTGGYVAIDSELAKEIYERVLDYSLMRDKPNNNRYFGDLFDKGIIGYFENTVMRSYGNELDVDIIDAIEQEAECLLNLEEDENAHDLIDQYVRDVISSTRSLSCPFIESPMGEARDPIYSCTFNNMIEPEKGDESPRAHLIKTELMNYGGEPDEDIPKNMIMFYQAFYGLRANDLSKFAPPEKSMTHHREGGEYFKAYYSYVADIHPIPQRSKQINPHIDRNWHIITKMPDLDEDYHKKQEYDIYAAFFWALVNRYIYLSEENSDKKVYKLRYVLLEMDDDELVVSNGTPCDKLYEVLDAIAIYPELVRNIHSKVEKLATYDLHESSSLQEGLLFNALKRFSVEEPGIGVDNVPSKSIFDLAMMMKKSCRVDTFCEDDVVEMLKVVIDEITKYLMKLCKKSELSEITGKIIMEQFNKHLESVALESKVQPDIYQESLFRKTGDVISTKLKELDLIKASELVKTTVEELINQN